jgi:peroxiredoxin
MNIKHFLLLSIQVCISFFYGKAQTKISNIEITAHILRLKDGLTFYLNSSSKVGIDSCISKNGKLNFKYRGEPNQLSISSVTDLGSDGKAVHIAMFWSDSSDIYIQGHFDRLKEVSIEGSPLNRELKEFAASVVPMEDKRNEYLVTLKPKQSDSLSLLIKKSYHHFIQQHQGSYSSMVILYYVTLQKTFTPAEARALLDSLFPSFTASYYYNAIDKFISNAEHLQIGAIAPGFTQPSLYGKPISLSDFRGKYVLLEFGASWCGPCRTESPYLVNAYRLFKHKGFEILGVSLDVDKNAWKKMVEADKMDWPQVSDLNGQRNEVAQLYGVDGVPQNFLLDPQGRIIAKDLRKNQLEEKLKEVMK